MDKTSHQPVRRQQVPSHPVPPHSVTHQQDSDSQEAKAISTATLPEPDSALGFEPIMQAAAGRSSASIALTDTTCMAASVVLDSSSPTVTDRRLASIIDKYGREGLQEDGCWTLDADFSRRMYLDLPFAVSTARCPQLELRFSHYDPGQLSAIDRAGLAMFFEQLGQALMANPRVSELTFRFHDELIGIPAAILAVIRNKQTLTKIVLDKDLLSPACRPGLTAALAGSRSIKILRIEAGMGYGEACSAGLGELLRASPSVRIVQLCRSHSIVSRRKPDDRQRGESQQAFHFLSLVEAGRLRQLDLRFTNFLESELDDLLTLCTRNRSLLTVSGVGNHVVTRRPHYAPAQRRLIRAALDCNWQQLVQHGAAALDLLLEQLPADSALPGLPWDIRTALSNALSAEVLEQLALGLDTGFAVPGRHGQHA